jgi:chromosome segregation ATPase
MSKPNDISLKVGVDQTDLLNFAKMAMPNTAKSLMSKAGIVKGAVAAAFIITAREILKATKEVEEFNKSLQETSRKTGASAESLQGWSKSAEKYGGKLEDVSSALSKFEMAKAKALEQGPEGNERKAFEKLGIGMYELATMNTEEAMKKLQNRIREFGGTSNNLSSLKTIFGESAKEVKFLNDNLDETIEKLKNTGGSKFLTNRQSEAIETMRKQSETKGVYKTTTDWMRDPMVVQGVQSLTVGAKMRFRFIWKSIFEGYDAAERDAIESYKGQYLSGAKGNLPMTISEQDAVGYMLQQRHGYKKSVLDSINLQLYERKSPEEKIDELRKNIDETSKRIENLPQGSTKRLAGLNDILSMEKQLKSLNPNNKELPNSPMAQIGGLMGIDVTGILAKIADGSTITNQQLEEIKISTAKMAAWKENPPNITEPSLPATNNVNQISPPFIIFH